MPDDQARYRFVLKQFSDACVQAGLTQTEAVILGAQFTGRSIATCTVRPAIEAQLQVASQAMRDACEAKIVGGEAPAIFMPEA